MSGTPRHEQNIVVGALFAVCAATSFTLMSLVGKWIGKGASTDTLLFARFFTSLALIMPWALKHPKETFFVAQPLQLILRSLATFLAFGCFFYVLKFITLGDALLLNNTFPLFVPLVALCLYRTKTSYKVWLGIIVGFIGIGLVLNPTPQFFKPVALIGLLSGALAAVSVVIIRSLTKTTPILQILFYNFLICSLLSGLFLPFGWQEISLKTLGLLVLLGLFGALYQVCSTLSFAKAPVRLTSPLMFLSILLGTLADFLFWNEAPQPLGFLGMALVILGGVGTIYFGKKSQKTPPRKPV